MTVVKHEMFPIMAAALEKVVDVNDSDLSTKAVDAAIDELKQKRSLTNVEVQYIRQLVDRARRSS